NPALDTDKKTDDKKTEEKKADDKTTGDKKDEKPAPNVEIDLEGFESRTVVLPPKSGSYPDIESVKGKLIFRRTPRAGTHDEKSPIVYFDFEEREEKTILDDADGLELTADGKKLLVTSKDKSNDVKYAIVDVKEKQKFEKP